MSFSFLIVNLFLDVICNFRLTHHSSIYAFINLSQLIPPSKSGMSPSIAVWGLLVKCSTIRNQGYIFKSSCFLIVNLFLDVVGNFRFTQHSSIYAIANLSQLITPSKSGLNPKHRSLRTVSRVFWYKESRLYLYIFLFSYSHLFLDVVGNFGLTNHFSIDAIINLSQLILHSKSGLNPKHRSLRTASQVFYYKESRLYFYVLLFSYCQLIFICRW
jgi:hypothetical protein